jgi:cell division protein FtsN
MEDNSKLFVFDKKEVILIFIFSLLMALTAFTLGVRLGKNLSLNALNLAEDRPRETSTTLKSVVEEKVEKLTQETNSEEKKVFDYDSRLEEEVRELLEENAVKKNKELDVPQKDETAKKDFINSNLKDQIYRPQGNISGKFTIQLAAFETKEEAENFADGFIVAGLDAVIFEAEIPRKGTWYRVGVGVFENMGQARQYLEDQKEFFLGKEYLINKLP